MLGFEYVQALLTPHLLSMLGVCSKQCELSVSCSYHSFLLLVAMCLSLMHPYIPVMYKQNKLFLSLKNVICWKICDCIDNNLTNNFIFQVLPQKKTGVGQIYSLTIFFFYETMLHRIFFWILIYSSNIGMKIYTMYERPDIFI